MLPELDVYPGRKPGLLLDDTFDRGTCGWTQLVDVSLGQGVLLLDTEITWGESGYSLLLSTEDYSNVAGKPWGSASAIKRLGRGPTVGKVCLEFWWAWGSLAGQDTPRSIDFGLDQCDPTGARKYFKFKWMNYDDLAATPGRITQWGMSDPSGTNGFVPIPGAVIDHGYNENKRNINHIECVFDVGAGVYDGLRVNGQGFGSLAATPDSSLRSYAPTAETLTNFKSGFNATMDIRNRVSTNVTKTWANLCRVRGYRA